MMRCPGQDQRYWKPDDIFELDCPECGTKIEFWKDEPRLKCPNCKKLIANPKLDMGCAEWCQYAKQCLGIAAGQDSGILCDKLIDEMKKALSDDQKRINHILKILEYADQIQVVEGGEPLVVKAVAVLCDIGTDKAQGPADEGVKEIGGLDTVKEILIKYGIKDELIEDICQIIAGCHGAQDIDSKEFRIIQDAYRLAEFEEQFAEADEEKKKKHIESTFKTKKGQQLASELLADKSQK